MRTHSTILVLLSAFASEAFADDVPEPETVCEFIADRAAKSNANINRDLVDKPNSAPFVRDYLLQTALWAETGDKTLDISRNVWEGVGARFYDDYVRWSHDSGYLPYRGKWYLILSQTDAGAARGARATGAYISAALNSEGLVCAFDGETDEQVRGTFLNYEYGQERGDPFDCDGVTKVENEVVATHALSDAEWKNLKQQFDEDLKPGWFEKNAYLGFPQSYKTGNSVTKIDIDNDGITEALVTINYSEARNYPCGLTYYDLISEDYNSIIKSDLREAALRAQGITRRENGEVNYACDRRNKLVKVGNDVVFSSEKPLLRRVAIIDSGEAKELCTSLFTIKPLVVFDVNQDTQ